MMNLTLRLLYNMSVRVRYAPSPTGEMHLGGIRTALYNYLYAKQHKGKFILRIQDTDQKRNIEGSAHNIQKVLLSLGIQPDESPDKPNRKYGSYTQSERLNLYKTYQTLL